MVYQAYDLGKQSPTVGTFFYASEYILFLEHLHDALSGEITFIRPEESRHWEVLQRREDVHSFPIGVLPGGAEICFLHYHTEEEAKRKWIERSKRINKDNIFILLTERDGLTKEQMKRLNKLPYPKAILTHLPMPEIGNTYYIRGFENEKQCGILSDFSMTKYPGHKWYDDFDFVKWFNQETDIKQYA